MDPVTNARPTRPKPPELSVEELQRRTGLARGTIHNALSVLTHVTTRKAKRLPRRAGSRGGKPTTLHSIVATAGRAWVFQFEHARASVYWTDILGNLGNAGMRPFDVDREPEAVIAWACDRLREVGKKLDHDYMDCIVGIGVAIPAPVKSSQRATGGVLPQWEGIDVPDRIEANLGKGSERHPLHIIADNDANLATLAEYRYGVGRETKHGNLLFVKTVDGPTGVGGGLVVHGEPMRGRGLAMEIGHLHLDGPPAEGAVAIKCPHCHSYTCLQARTSAPGLLGIDPEGKWDRMRSWKELVDSAGISAETAQSKLASAMQWGDPDLIAAQEEAIQRLRHEDAFRAIAAAARETGRALAQAVTLLDPDAIVVGGPLAEAWLATGPGSIAEVIGDPLHESFKAHVPFDDMRTLRIRKATSINRQVNGAPGSIATVVDSTAQGAAAAVLDKHLIDFLVLRAEALNERGGPPEEEEEEEDGSSSPAGPRPQALEDAGVS